MSLAKKYQAFLAHPSSAALADNASLHYVTTLTSINDPAAIGKHFAAQEKLLTKKSEKVLSTVEGRHDICLDIETTLEFIAGGGAYLPGLDDNFLADRTVTFPTIHIVHFDQEQKISQIRLYWDQGSLLKLVDVIGARARNWPIRDGKDQARLIATSAATFAQPSSAASSRRSTTTSGGADRVVINERPTSSASRTSNAMNDPHATLALFQPRDVNQEGSYSSKPAVQRAQSAKPPPRNLNELFVGDISPSTENGNPAQTPQKNFAKAGGGRNFQSNRLFDNTQEERPEQTPMSIKTHAKKYDHFEFDDGEGDQATPKVRDTARPETRSKHQSQWDFQDFVTPDKVGTKVLPNNARHFGWSDDEAETSPVRRPVVHKPRPEQQPHFEFKDDGTPVAQQRKEGTGKGHMHNSGLGLYKDHVLHTTSDDEDGGDDAHQGDSKRDKGHNTNNAGRKKDFDAHWEMKDDYSPNPQKTTNFNGNNNNKPLPADTQKVLKGLDANWAMYDQSPGQDKQAERGINIAGNGMGSRKGAGPSWSIGGDDEDLAVPVRSKGGQAGARQTENEHMYDETVEEPQQKKNAERGINIAGNGMGGRMGAGRSWNIGGDDEDLAVPVKSKGGHAGARQTENEHMYDENPGESKQKNLERGINISGNGMGGRKGAEMSWNIGGDGEHLPAATKERGGTAAARQTENKNFWDF